MSWLFIGMGVVLLAAEHWLSTIRMRLIADAGGLPTAMRVTAWHAIWLIVLPLRLGEVAWIVVMRRAYGWNAATAVVSAALQRLFDLTVVAAVLLLTLPAVLDLYQGRQPVFLALAVAVGLLALTGLATLHTWLRFVSRSILGFGRPGDWHRRVLRHLNKAQHQLRSQESKCRRRSPFCPWTWSMTTMVAGPRCWTGFPICSTARRARWHLSFHAGGRRPGPHQDAVAEMNLHDATVIRLRMDAFPASPAR